MTDIVVEHEFETGELPSSDWARRAVLVGALLVLGLAVLAAFLAPVLVPRDPMQQDLFNTLADPSATHLLGTDQLGRDVLSRLILAARTSLSAALLAIAISTGIGIIPGLIAGYFGGMVEAGVMRVTDTIMAFPPLILAIGVVGVLGPGLTNAMIAVGIITAPRFLRLLRGVALRLRAETFVAAAKATGVSHAGIIFRHLLPNALSPITVQVALTAGMAILAEASLSFIGLGVQAPTPSWGAMISHSTPYMSSHPHLIILPGLVIAATVMAFNLVGDAIRDKWGEA